MRGGWPGMGGDGWGLPGMVEMVGNGRDERGMARGWPGMAGDIWPGMVENVRKMLGIAGNGWKWPEMAWNCRRWPGKPGNDQKWLEMAGKMLRMAVINNEWPEIAREQLEMVGESPDWRGMAGKRLGMAPWSPWVTIHPWRSVAVRDYERKARSALRFFLKIKSNKIYFTAMCIYGS